MNRQQQRALDRALAKGGASMAMDLRATAASNASQRELQAQALAANERNMAMQESQMAANLLHARVQIALQICAFADQKYVEPEVASAANALLLEYLRG